MSTVNLTPAELAAAMRVSTRTIARWDSEGCPCEWAGSRRRYDLAAVQAWNRERAPQCQSEKTPKAGGTQRLASVAAAYTDAFRSVRVRVMPSGLKQS
jgi:phage terminase Nu1 subunit (DNA packaging protein)